MENIKKVSSQTIPEILIDLDYSIKGIHPDSWAEDINIFQSSGYQMINEFEDFKLLLSLGFKSEEIINLSFTSEELQYMNYKSSSKIISNELKDKKANFDNNI